MKGCSTGAPRAEQTLKCSSPTTHRVNSLSNSTLRLPKHPSYDVRHRRPANTPATTTAPDLNPLHLLEDPHRRITPIGPSITGRRYDDPSSTTLFYPADQAFLIGTESYAPYPAPTRPTRFWTSPTHLIQAVMNMRYSRP